ncbi:MAG: penicillin-binding protein activator [Proteobacteria bacterium]|nr:penicillin-binding protein activator [Pseudomonadota bacterium]
MRRFRLLFIPILFVLLACIPKTDVVNVAVEDNAGEALFSKAENLFSAQKYNKALEAYSEYIVRFPESSLAPSALLRMGNIYDGIGENKKSLSSYLHIINYYPKSIYIPDVKIKVLEGYFKQKMFEDVINYSASIFSDKLSDNYISKAYVLVGDAQISLNRSSDAVVSFFNARSKNMEHDNEVINTKLKDAVSQLEDNDIQFLIESTKDYNLKGYLQYQIGLRYYEKQKYKEAASVFTSIIQKAPTHENVKEAKIVLQKIYDNSTGKPFAIGCILPLTGAFNVFGNKALKGIKLALSRFSDEKGQALVNLVVRDTESDPDSAAIAVQELVKENVSAIIGPMGTDESVVAAKEAQANNVPIILLTQKEGITKTGNFVFRNFLMPEMQVKAIVKYAMEKRGIKRFAILYPNENYGAKFMGLFYDEVTASGGTIVSAESYDPSHTDFTDIIKKIIGKRTYLYNNIENEKSSESSSTDEEQNASVDKKQNEKKELLLDFEAIFIPDSPAKAGLIIPQLIYEDVNNVYLLGTNLWHSQKMITMAGEFMQDKTIIPDAFYGEKDSTKMKDFYNSFIAFFGEEPGFIEAVAYDTAMMLFQTVSKSSDRFPESVRNELIKIKNFDGLTGLTSFDSEQDAQKKLYLITIKGNRFVELGTD